MKEQQEQHQQHEQFTVLVVGGYGIVGSYLTELLAKRNKNVKVLVAGRNMEKAQRAASKITGAEAVIVDINRNNPLEYLYTMPDAIIVSVNDTHDHLLRQAIQRRIPILDIARWHERVEAAKQVYKDEDGNSPVILASGWVASVPSIVAKAHQITLEPFQNIDIDILLSLKDKTGPDSVTSFVDAHLPFHIWENGQKKEVKGFSSSKSVHFSDKRTFTTHRMRCPEQATLVESGVTQGASVRIAFDSQIMNRTFACLICTGLWGHLSRKTRKSILHNSKNTNDALHEIIVSIKEKGRMIKISVIDQVGQSHLTAISAVSQLERLLGLQGRIQPQHGVTFPEQARDVQMDLMAIQDMGISIKKVV
jgi:saccharopine dehydrogenase-like NADP-dependent oxidoreductase